MPTRLETSHEKGYMRWLDNYVFWIAIKIYRRGWPDRLVLGPGAIAFFIEFKRDKDHDLRKLQNFWREYLTKLGFKVYVCRSTTEAKKVTRKYFQS